MPRSGPSHIKKDFTAKHIFTDREEPRAAFAEALEAQQNQKDTRLLNFYGIGGQGKTALCEQFILKLREDKKHNPELGWAKLDFEIPENRAIASALLSIRLQLAGRCKIPFPAFDTAFARYFAFSRQGHSLKDAHPDLFKQPSDILQDMEGVLGDVVGDVTKDVIQEIPGAGAIFKNLHKLNTKLKTWWQKRGIEVLRDLDSLEQYKLLEHLPKYLGADIYDWLFDEKSKESGHKRRLVILLDTYEALWRDQPTKKGLEAMRVDAWLRKLVEETPGVFYAILGRDKLAWSEIDADWKSDIEPHLLGGLSDEDANKFLLQVPIAEEAIRNTIVESSQGIPFYLDLQVDLYEKLKQANRKPQPSSFGGRHQEILARFTDHLDDNSRRALQIVSSARFIDENLVQQLAEEFIGGKASISLKQLTDYSFWKKQDGVWVLHALMREYLQARQQKDETTVFHDIHQCLFEQYDHQLEKLQRVVDIKGIHATALSEAAYHLKQFEIVKYPQWASKRGELFNRAYAWQEVEKLWESALAIAKSEFGEDYIETAVALGDLANMYKSQGRYTEAETLQQRSLSIKEKALGEEHLSVATTLNNLAGLYISQGRYVEAEPLYRRDLLITERELGKEHPDVATTLNNLAELYRTQGRYVEAEPLYQRSLSIKEKALGEEHPLVANTLNNLALLYKTQGRYPEAESLYQRDLSISEKTLGKEHPSVATTLNNLAGLYKSEGRYAEAEPLYQHSLSINEKTLGEDHPSVATTLNNLAGLYESQGKYAEAEPLYQSSLSIKEKALGEDHPSVATTLNNLAGLYKSQRRYAEAEPLYQRSHSILEIVFPDGHPNIDILKGNFDDLKKLMDDESQA